MKLEVTNFLSVDLAEKILSTSKERWGMIKKLCGRDYTGDRKSEKQESVTFRKER